MEPVDALIRGLKLVAQLLDAVDMDPDPARTDWGMFRPQLQILREQIDREVLAHAEPAFAALIQDQNSQQMARGRVAAILAEASMVFHAAGDRPTASDLLGRAARIAPSEGPVRDEIAAAGRDPEGYALLIRGRWLLAQGRTEHADAWLRPARKKAREGVIRKAMEQAMNGPRPLTGGAPVLFTLNGFGTGMYGSRDSRPDGTFVSTLCLCALFVPFLPLKSYRVRRDGRRYFFLAREPLSPFARFARLGLVGALALGFTGFVAQGYLTSPEHLATVAVNSARQAEAQHRTEAALEGYQLALRQYANSAGASTVREAAEGVVRLASAGVHEPMTPERVDEAARVITQFEALPESVRGGTAAMQLFERLERWELQLGDSTEERAEAQLRLATLGEGVVPAARRDRVEERLRELHRHLGALLADAWPREALAHWVLAGDPAAIRESASVVRLIAASPSLAHANRDDLTAWATAARPLGDPALLDVASMVDSALAAGQHLADDTERAAGLEQNDAIALSAAMTRTPGDQDVIAALAALRRSTGDSAGALEMLRAVAPVGRWIDKGQRLIAGCLFDTGKLDEADALLSHFVSTRLPTFQSAQHRYRTATHDATEELERQLQSGDVPSDLRSRLEGAGETERVNVLREWAVSRLAADPRLLSLKQAYEQQAETVPASLQLATIKLRRAADSSGAERATLLADAERLFLAIRDEAQDVPEFHLGLGQVYHRLGRTDESEREFAELLGRNEALTSLAVAKTYRELGLVVRAREVAQAVFEKNEQPASGYAAILLATIADLPSDQETWLRRAPQDSPDVAIRLREVEAHRLFRTGNYRGADALLARIADDYRRDATHSAVAANNAAIAEHERYTCTGDPNRLRASTEGLEAALRLQPDDTLLLANLGDSQGYQAAIRVLDRYVRTSVLRLDHARAQHLLGLLLEGPARAEVQSTLRTDPSVHRTLDLARSEETLAPESVGAYERELDLDTLLDDTAALRQLDTRVNALARVESAAEDALRTRVANGSADAAMREELDGALRQCDDVLTAAQAMRHAPTLAAAHVLRADVLMQRAVMFNLVDDADAAVTALREADRTSPTVGTRAELPWALFAAALLHARAENPAIDAAVRAEPLPYRVEVMMHRLATGAGGAAARAALRARPEVIEALTILRETQLVRPSLGSWIVARALGDADLERITVGARTRDSVLINARIDARLHPNDGYARQRLALATQ